MKKNMWKKIIRAAAVTALSVGCAACGNAGGTSASDNGSVQAEQKEEDLLKIGVFDMGTLYLMETFDDLGYYEANDANVEFVYFPVYSDAITAFNTNNVDMICYAASEAVAPVVNGVDCKIIGVFDTSNGLDGIAASSEVTSIEELKGKTVATEIGSVDHMILQKVLERHGLQESDVNLINMAAGDAVAALAAGSIDAVSTWEPQLSMAAKNGSIIYSTKEDPSLVADVFLVHSEKLDEQYDNVKAILKTWYESAELYKEDPKQYAASAAEKGGLTEEEFLQLMDVTKLVTLPENNEAFTMGEGDYKYLNVLLHTVGEFLYEGELVTQQITEEQIAEMLDDRIINDLLSE